MKEDNKLLDATIALAHEMKGMRRDMNTQLGEMNTQLKGLNHRVDNLERQQVKTNLHLAEHSRSIMALAEQQQETNIKLQDLRSDFNGLRSDLKETNVKLDGLSSDFKKYANSNNLIISQHETRIIRLEDTTFGKDAQRISMVKEPNAEYKKKKKN